jgi:hypothetical protein
MITGAAFDYARGLGARATGGGMGVVPKPGQSLGMVEGGGVGPKLAARSRTNPPSQEIFVFKMGVRIIELARSLAAVKE